MFSEKLLKRGLKPRSLGEKLKGAEKSRKAEKSVFPAEL